MINKVISNHGLPKVGATFCLKNGCCCDIMYCGMVEKFSNLASREDILQFLIIVMHMQEYAVNTNLGTLITKF